MYTFIDYYFLEFYVSLVFFFFLPDPKNLVRLEETSWTRFRFHKIDESKVNILEILDKHLVVGFLKICSFFASQKQILILFGLFLSTCLRLAKNRHIFKDPTMRCLLRISRMLNFGFVNFMKLKSHSGGFFNPT